MAVCIKSITFDCADPYRLAQFWRQLTGFSEDPGNGNAPDDPEVLLFSPDGSLALLFIAVPEPGHVRFSPGCPIRDTRLRPRQPGTEAAVRCGPGGDAGRRGCHTDRRRCASGSNPSPITCRLDLARLACQVMNAVIRIETSSPGSSTPSLAT
jgi:hypothetical protein